jgi:hypothetical protein
MIAASVAASGVVAGFIVNIARGVRMDQSLALIVADYFSYFTIVASLATIVVLLIAARRGGPLATPDGIESPALAIALATTSAATIILGVVYNALLRGLPSDLPSPDPTIIAVLDRWEIETLHVVLPLYVIVDVLFAPRRRALPWGALGAIVGFPLLWALYTMVRGPLVPAPDGSTPYWYPYPFLDPHGPAGFATPTIYIGAIAAGFLMVGIGLVLLSRVRARRARARVTAVADTASPHAEAGPRNDHGG